MWFSSARDTETSKIYFLCDTGQVWLKARVKCVKSRSELVWLAKSIVILALGEPQTTRLLSVTKACAWLFCGLGNSCCFHTHSPLPPCIFLWVKQNQNKTKLTLKRSINAPYRVLRHTTLPNTLHTSLIVAPALTLHSRRTQLYKCKLLRTNCL